MPLLTMRLRVFLPMCTILVPVSACCMLLVSATLKNSPAELSPLRMQLGYFQVMADPVSTCSSHAKGIQQAAIREHLGAVLAEAGLYNRSIHEHHEIQVVA